LGRPPGVCCPQLRGHAPLNCGAPDRHTAPSSRDVASMPFPRRPLRRGVRPGPLAGCRPQPPAPLPPNLAQEGLSRSVGGLDRPHGTPARRGDRPTSVSHGPYTPRDARGPHPPPCGSTRTPWSHLPTTYNSAARQHHPATYPIRAGCNAVFSDSFLLPPHDSPSTPLPWFPSPLASCCCGP